MTKSHGKPLGEIEVIDVADDYSHLSYVTTGGSLSLDSKTEDQILDLAHRKTAGGESISVAIPKHRITRK